MKLTRIGRYRGIQRVTLAEEPLRAKKEWKYPGIKWEKAEKVVVFDSTGSDRNASYRYTFSLTPKDNATLAECAVEAIADPSARSVALGNIKSAFTILSCHPEQATQ